MKEINKESKCGNCRAAKTCMTEYDGEMYETGLCRDCWREKCAHEDYLESLDNYEGY